MIYFLYLILVSGQSFAFPKNRYSTVRIQTPESHRHYIEAKTKTINQQIQLNEINFRLGYSRLDQIITIGDRLWSLIIDLSGELKINSMTDVAAIPATAISPSGLSNWRVAELHSFRTSINGIFTKAFTISYTITFNYGGAFNGNGNYLANVSVIPFEVNCGFGWDCNVDVKVGDSVNIGYPESPVAGLPLNLSIVLKSKFNSKAVSFHYMIYGNGQIEQNGDVLED